MFNFSFNNYKKWCQTKGIAEGNLLHFRIFRGLCKVSEMGVR